MKWEIEEFSSGTVFAYDKIGKRICLYSQYHPFKEHWNPLTNNDNMDQVINRVRELDYGFNLRYGPISYPYIHANFSNEKFMFSGIDKDKLTAITKALIDFMDFKEALQYEQKHIEVGPDE